MYASKTRKEEFSDPRDNCQRNGTDLAGSQVTSCRPPGRLQKRPDVAVRTADGSRRSADAGDEQCLSSNNAHNSAMSIVHRKQLQTDTEAAETS